MKVIAISAFKGSGKDTAADYLVKSHSFTRVSFADPLKNLVSDLFDIPRSYLDDPQHKERPIYKYPVPSTDEFTSMVSNFMVREFRTLGSDRVDPKYVKSEHGVLQTFLFDKWENLYHTPRSLAILLGSSMRAGTPSFWVQKAIRQIKEDLNENVVISDLRYKSEIKQLREAFGDNLVTVRINRFDSSPSTDPSELDLIGVKHDFELDNRGTREDLYAQLQELLPKLNANYKK